MKAVHFGAGNIGRGFIGSVLHDNEYELCFIDVTPTLIEELNTVNSYKVALIGSQPYQTFDVDRVCALNSMIDDEKVIEKIVEADLITTSVGVGNLEKIAGLLARGLQKRAELGKVVDVIANENAINATTLLKNFIQKVRSTEDMALIEKNTGFVDSAIDRQALSTEVAGKEIPLVEPYFEWVVNEDQFKNKKLPRLKGVTYVKNMQPYIERKLYIVNAGHAVAAYVGQLFDYQTVQEALANQEVFRFVKQLMEENAQYLKVTYEMDPQELSSFIDKTLSRHSNPEVHDDITRVGRSPLRKLGAQERLIAPLTKCYERGLPVKYGVRAVAALLQYDDPADPEAVELEESIEENGPIRTLQKYADLHTLELIGQIVAVSKEIEKNQELIFKEE